MAMNNIKIDLPCVQECERWAEKFASVLPNQAILTFKGEIGVGKTTFIRAMLRAKGVVGSIKSPTFALVETYDISSGSIHHFDLYRIADEQELELIGFRDYFVDSICCIEWPEKAPNYLLYTDIQFMFSLGEKGARRMIAHAFTKRGLIILAHLVN